MVNRLKSEAAPEQPVLLAHGICTHNPDRLAALDAYAILDTDAEASFDGIVLLAR